METGSGRRRGRGGQRLLYWFRTPPGVRVGRAALDDEAIRLLEQHNPDVQFDWARLLKEAVPEPPRRERERDGRDGRDRDRRERRDPRQPPRPRPMDTSAAAAPPMPSPEVAEEMQALAEAAEERAAEHADVLAADSAGSFAADRAESLAADRADAAEDEWVSSAADRADRADHAEDERDRLAADRADFEEPLSSAADRADAAAEERVSSAVDRAHSADEERTEPVEPRELARPSEPAEPPGPAAARLGADGLARLRSRYLDLQNRLAEKQDLEPDVKAELAADLERLNPDAWHTSEDVSAALEQYESIFERLRSIIGRHPRRRV